MFVKRGGDQTPKWTIHANSFGDGHKRQLLLMAYGEYKRA